MRIWPNPARPGEALRVSITAPPAEAGLPGDLDVGVYDLAGRRIASLGNGSVDAHGVLWFEWTTPSRETAAGLYVVRAASARSGFSRVSKLAILE
jgi:hypothetical protein